MTDDSGRDPLGGREPPGGDGEGAGAGEATEAPTEPGDATVRGWHTPEGAAAGTPDLPPEGRKDPEAESPRKKWLLFAVAGLAVVVAVLFSRAPVEAVEEGGHYGWTSLLPALTTLVLVFVTRDVVSSLFLGIVVAGFVLAGADGFSPGDVDIIDTFLIPSIGSESFALILLVYLWALGGLIGIWTRTGGALYFARWAARLIVRGPRSAKFFAWLMGVVFHQGGTISTVLAGTTVRSVTDEQKVSHEETTYVVDSTASPIATVIPLNAWPVFVGGLLAGTIPLWETETEVVAFFFQSVLFNGYGFFAILFTLLFAWEYLPWEGSRMTRARHRARETGKLDRDEAEPLSAEELTQLKVPTGYRTGLEDFLVPIVVLVGVALVWGVLIPAFEGLVVAGDYEVFLDGIDVPIAQAFGLGVLSAMVVALAKGMAVKEVVDGFVEGCKGVTIGAIVLALAVTLGLVSESLGTANFIVGPFEGMDIAVVLPAIFMAVCMGVAFAMGTSWGTYAVVFPLAMPLAWTVNPDPLYIAVAFGAVLGGAVFGDQCSPISDTTILSSLACGCDVMDHVLTQLPLAVAAAVLGAAVSTVTAMAVVWWDVGGGAYFFLLGAVLAAAAVMVGITRLARPAGSARMDGERK